VLSSAVSGSTGGTAMLETRDGCVHAFKQWEERFNFVTWGTLKRTIKVEVRATSMRAGEENR
jgi:hypothetical protein